MRADNYLLLGSSIATFLVVSWAAVRENVLAEWRTVQLSIRRSLPAAEAQAFDVELRQIVAPRAGVVDRCVSCHVGMAPGEKGVRGDRLFGPHPKVFHDPAEIGCTICHGGQGRATTAVDAHGNVPHWTEPMIPTKYAYAGCGTCHAFVGIPTLDRLEEAEALVDRLGCPACHRLGAKRPAPTGTSTSGPDLSAVGVRGYSAAWVGQHPSLEVSKEQRDLLRDFLASRVGAPALIEAQATFHQLGCRGCHAIGGTGGENGPALDRVGLKDPGQTPFQAVFGPHTLETFYKEHFRDPGRVVPRSRMPKQELTEAQIDALTYFVFSLRRKELPAALWAKDRILVERFKKTEFVADGPSRFAALCTGCHGPGGKGGMANPNAVRKDFPPINQVATRLQLFTQEEVQVVLDDLREHGALSAARPLPVSSFDLTLAQYGAIEDVITKGNSSGLADPKGPEPLSMPSWGKVLSETDIREILQHLLSISEVEEDEE